MQNPILDLLGASLVPELGADVAAGSSGHVHLVLVGVAALGADPHQLAVVLLDLDLTVIAADLAVVGLGVQLGVHDVVVNELHHFQHRVDVILHVGNFHITDSAAGGQLLELCLEAQLGERVDGLGHMDVVGVGDVALVRNAGDQAEALLQALGELVGGGFQRCSVQGIVDILRRLPLKALVVHLLHHGQGERLGLVVGVGLAGHVFDALIKSGVAQRNGGVAAIEQLVDGFALGQPRQRTVLPQDGRGVGQRALEPLMTAPQRPVAQLQTVFKDLPEFGHIPAGGQRHVHQIDGDDALIEPAVILGLARLIVSGSGHIVPAIAGTVWGQEAAAAHAGVDVSVTRGLPLGELVLPHLLFADIVGNHPLGSTLGGKPGQVPVRRPLPDVVFLQNVNELGEGGGDPHALLVLHALVALAQGLLNDHGEILLLLLALGFVEVHEHGDEGSLSVGGHQGDDLILDGLNAPAHFLPQAVLHHLGDGLLRGRNAESGHFPLHGLADLLPADLNEGGKMRQGNGLSAILVGCHLGDDLGGDVAGGGEGMGLLDQGAGDDGAVLQHVLQIHQIAVVHMLGIIVRVMEMDDAGLVGVHHFLGKQDTTGDVLADLARHVVPLDGVDGGVLVGVLLLDFLVIALDQAEDAVVRGVGLTQKAAGIAVGNIFLGHLESAVGHDGLFHQILNFLYGRAAAHFLAGDLDALGNSLDLQRGHTYLLVHRIIGLGHGHDDLINVENDFRTVTFNNLHRLFLLGFPFLNQFVHGLLYNILWFCQ